MRVYYYNCVKNREILALESENENLLVVFSCFLCDCGYNDFSFTALNRREKKEKKREFDFYLSPEFGFLFALNRDVF